MAGKPELLAPAGDLEKLRTAVLYGADSVYLGGQLFSLRAGAGNFSQGELVEGLYHAHSAGVRVFVAVNIFAKNSDLKDLEEYIRWIESAGVDGIIVSDPGVFQLARTIAPRLDIHISTQANTGNAASVKFWQQLGARRVVLAREMSLEEIAETHAQTTVELETFIHGAMCMAYSGRCLLSSYLSNRSANRGDCSQPCRWKYHLVEEKRPGEYMAIQEDDRGTYIMNSKDLCMLEHFPKLAEAGVKAFKVEGRMKSIHYLATVVNSYRTNIDEWWQNKGSWQLNPAWLDELRQASHRPWSTGFFFGPASQETERGGYIRPAAFVGAVRGWQDGCLLVEQRGNFALRQRLELVLPGGLPQSFVLESMQDAATGEAIERAPHAQQLVKIPWPEPIQEFVVLRRREDDM